MVGIPRVYPNVIVTRNIHRHQSADQGIISYRLNPSQIVIEGQTDCSHLMSSYSFSCTFLLTSLRGMERDLEWGFVLWCKRRMEILFVFTSRSKFELLVGYNPLYNGQECQVRQRTQDWVWDWETGGDTQSLVTAYTGGGVTMITKCSPVFVLPTIH